MSDAPINVDTYVGLLNALNAAHRVVTAQVVDGELPTHLYPVLEAIDAAIGAAQIARHPELDRDDGMLTEQEYLRYGDPSINYVTDSGGIVHNDIVTED